MKIAVHSLVRNEARYVWFAVMSVIDYVDRILIWDTGSTDGTKEIIRTILKDDRAKGRVSYRQVGEITAEQFSLVRQEMLDETHEDWFLVVDGDEVWWDQSIENVTDFIHKHGESFETVVVPTINLVGDIYHHQEEKAGHYRLAGRVGHLNLRGVNRKIPGLASDRPHGTWGWVDEDGRMIQDRNPEKIKFIDAPYMHASFLRRSGVGSGDLDVPKRDKKLKHEVGIGFARDFYYPEVFFRARPDIVRSPWERMERGFYLRSLLETPLRKIKRRVIPVKEGY